MQKEERHHIREHPQDGIGVAEAVDAVGGERVQIPAKMRVAPACPLAASRTACCKAARQDSGEPKWPVRRCLQCSA